MAVRIVTDSSCDLTAEAAAALGIEVVPLTIRFGDEEFVDRVELRVDEFYRRMAAPPDLPADRRAGARRLRGGLPSLPSTPGPTPWCASTSRPSCRRRCSRPRPRPRRSRAQPTFGSSTAGRSRPGSARWSRGQPQRGADGASADDIAAGVEDLIGRQRIWATLDTLDNLKKGGRIGGAKAFLASLALDQARHLDPRRRGRGGRQAPHPQQGAAVARRPGARRAGGRAPPRRCTARPPTSTSCSTCWHRSTDATTSPSGSSGRSSAPTADPESSA